MRRNIYVGLVLLVVVPLLTSSPALALANRVFVSQRSGNDANSCDNILTPCQTFAGAVLQLNPGGEAIVLDSGGYGPVTITQALTIEAPPGVVAFIHPPSGNAINIAAGASDVVILRGLVLNGGSGDGIYATSVGSLHIESCVISGFGNGGIRNNAPNSSIFIKDTISRKNYVGFLAEKGRGTVDHCRFDGNQYAGIYDDGADVTVRNSAAASNHWGSIAINFGAENTVLNVYDSIATNNSSDGLYAQVVGSGFVIARVANASISENIGMGLNNFGGTATFESLGNNFVRGNVGGDVSAGITIVSAH